MRLLAALLTLSLCDAQSFDVASIKLHPGEVTMSAGPFVRGSRVVATALTALDLITGAYNIRYDQVSGGPGWIKNDHYDVDAKAPGDVPPTAEQARTMMRNLLAERFQLKLHRESRSVPVYVLVIDKNGPKLKQGDPIIPVGLAVKTSDKGLHVETKRGTMEKLATQLSATAGRPVVDKTGLTGSYEFTLDWFPASRLPPPDSTVPSMFNALQEQLGLKLESSTAPQEFLVINSVERPSEN